MSEEHLEPVFPGRPSVPLPFVLFLALWTGLRAALWGGRRAAWGAAGVAAAGALAAMIRHHRGVGVWLVIASLSFGALLGVGTLDGQEQAAKELGARPVSGLSFVAERDSSKSSRGWRTLARAEGSGVRAVVWLLTNEPLEAGTEVRGAGHFVAWDGSEFARSSWARGIVGTVSLRKVEMVAPTGLRGVIGDARHRLLGRLDVSDPGQALVAGMALGDKAALKELGLDTVFSAAGLAHLTAVSGTHLALVAAGIQGILRGVGLTGRRSGAVTLAVTGFYVLLCGAPVSALRAWAMTAAALGSTLFRRRAQPLGALGVVGLLMLGARPGLTGDVGFCLSVACVAGLGLMNPWVQGWLEFLFARSGPVPRRADRRRRLLKVRRSLRSNAASALTCSIASAPLCAGAFSQVALLGPVSNLLVGPLIAPFLLLGGVGMALAPLPGLGALVLGLVSVFGGLLCQMAQAIAALPFAVAPVALDEPWPQVATVAGLGLLWALWPQPPTNGRPPALLVGAAGVCGACAALFWLLAATEPPSVTVLDVGQGDAILVRDGLRAALVDTGPDASVVSGLARNGVRCLDYVLLTHQHDDHTAGLEKLPGFCAVGSVAVAQGVGDSLAPSSRRASEALGAPVVELRSGDVVSVGSWRLQVLWPREPCDGSENDQSLCLLMEREGRTWGLLTGDAESDVLASFVDALPHLAFYKAGHHGSAVSISGEQAAELAPLVAIASAGEDNAYGHPSSECAAALEDAGAVFLCTKDAGDVRVTPDGDAVRVRCSEGAGAFL